MKNALFCAILLAAVAIPSGAAAQQDNISQTIAGTRLDLTANGEVTRVPDVALISAGVVVRSPSAAAALQDSASKMSQLLKALKRAGVAERDVQTSNVSLNPEYRYLQNQPPELVSYTASNSLTIRFRDIRNSGAILDSLVREGANQINGPTLVVDKPEAALDEARAKAVASGRARAELYARSLGMHVARVVSVSESATAPLPVPIYARAEVAGAPATKIEPGEQKLEVNLAMVFELQ